MAKQPKGVDAPTGPDADASAGKMVSLGVRTKANKGGRPRALEPNATTLKELTGLAGLQCTTREASAFFNVTEPTFAKFLKDHPEAREAWEFGKDQGKVSLRRRQFALAEKNAAMAIWLGKQWLGQTDRQEVTGAGGGPIEYASLSPAQRDARIAELLAKRDAKPEVEE